MKKYRLLKDLLGFKKGAVFNSDTVRLDLGNVGESADIECYPEWFEEIGEGCKHERVTRLGDLSKVGLYIICQNCSFEEFKKPKLKPSEWIDERAALDHHMALMSAIQDFFNRLF